MLLISRDGGKSYNDYTSPVFWEYKNNHLYRISQNPQNPSSLVTIAVRDGLFQSKDFGAKWENFFPYSLGIYIAFADFHPLDTATLFLAKKMMPYPAGYLNLRMVETLGENISYREAIIVCIK